MSAQFEAFKKQNVETGDLDVTFIIGGKKLFAHKLMLQKISTTFESMLSERWTSKDDAIPIETFGYNDFYQFLTFLYSEECQLTNANISTMVDIAEFFQVSNFKKFCEGYLRNRSYTSQNIITVYELANKYSLDELKKNLGYFIEAKIWDLFNDNKFLQIPKEIFLEMMSKMNKSAAKDEEVFLKVYEWAENQAKKKMEMDPNLNLDETVKEVLTDFMPLFDFAKMDSRFVIKFVVGKSLLPPGPELSALSLDETLPNVIVRIINENGRMMKGKFYDPGNIFEGLQKLKNRNSFKNDYYYYWETMPHNRPSQEFLKKDHKITWYLVYAACDNFAVKHYNKIDAGDFLIAEMFAEKRFRVTRKSKIRAIRF